MNKISIRVVFLFEMLWICFIVFFINTYTNKSIKEKIALIQVAYLMTR